MKILLRSFGLVLLLGTAPLAAAWQGDLVQKWTDDLAAAGAGELRSQNLGKLVIAADGVVHDIAAGYKTAQATEEERKAAFKKSIVQGKWERRARVALDVAVFSALTVGCAAACYYLYPALLADPRGMRPGKGGLVSLAILFAPILGLTASGVALKNLVAEGFTGQGPYVGSGIWKVRTKQATA